jgi:hypothetical protein
MDIVDPKKATTNLLGYGPVFGGGQAYDILIANHANQNRFSGAYFPTSYNNSELYLANQDSWKRFSGN